MNCVHRCPRTISLSRLPLVLCIFIAATAAFIANMAPAILEKVLPASMTGSATTTAAAVTGAASDYLLPLPSGAFEPSVLAELQAIERDFSLDKALLDKTMRQMLWEYQTGLAQHADDSNRDTFLPMM